jgi:ankyrin repeat protein
LLARGADANADGAQAMLHAAQNNREDIVKLLLQGGFDRQKHGEDVLKRLAGKPVNDGLRQLIMPESKPYAAEAPDPQILCESCILSNGLKLTTVFNFRSRQQLVIAERSDAGPAPMTVTAQNFCDIKDKDVIAAAAQRLTDLGGQPAWPPVCQKTTGLRLG